MKKYVLLVIVVLVLASSGYYYVNRGKDWYELLSNNNTISYAVADSESNMITKANVQKDILAFLSTYEELRSKFDETMNTKKITNNEEMIGKSGCVYIDANSIQENNSTLYLALRNKVCASKISGSLASDLGNLADKAYADIETTGKASLAATINAYYDLLDDNTGIYNGDAVLSREVYYKLLYKTYNGVNSNISVKAVQDKAYIKSDTSLKGSITQAEAIYLIMNNFYSDKLKDYTPSNNSIGNMKNVSSVLDKAITKQLDIGVEKTDRYREVTLKYMLDHSSKNEIDSTLFNSISLAYELGIIDNTFNWNEPVTKDSAINIIMNSYLAMNDVYGYVSEVDTGDYDVVKLGIYKDDHIEISYDDNGNVEITVIEKEPTPGVELLDKVEIGLLDDLYNVLIDEGKTREEAQATRDEYEQRLINAHIKGQQKQQEQANGGSTSSSNTTQSATKQPVNNSGSSNSNYGSTESYYGQNVARTDSNGNKYNSQGQILTGDGWVAVGSLSEELSYLYNEGQTISDVDSNGYWVSGILKGQLDATILAKNSTVVGDPNGLKDFQME